MIPASWHSHPLSVAKVMGAAAMFTVVGGPIIVD